jgi:uncharacterized protein (TIGR00730 family)
MQKIKQKRKKAIIQNPNTRIERLLLARGADVSPWRMFKIMAEFVSGFEFLRKYKKAASIFGSARLGFKNEIYREAEKLAYYLAKDGFTIITGGGPGVMEAANKGAFAAGGRSVGLNIKGVEDFERKNQFVQEAEAFKYFFVRKVMLEFASQVYVFFPGGFGTLDELFEMITLVQTKKIPAIPIILVNKEYWKPLLDWIREQMYEKNKAISAEDMSLYHLVSDADDARRIIKKLLK